MTGLTDSLDTRDLRAIAEGRPRDEPPRPQIPQPQPGPRQREERHPGLLHRIVHGTASLLTGMGITIRNFLDVKGVVTQQYPENRASLTMPERFRGQVIMPHDADGEHKCTGCTICEKACPNGSISVLNTTNLAGKKVLGRYIYRLDQCTICGLCVEMCPYDAIHMGHDFETATTDKNDLVLILNKKEGRM